MLKGFLVVLVALVALIARNVINSHGGHVVVPNNQFSSCRKITGLGATGVEDIAIHPRTGIAFLSSSNRRNPSTDKDDPEKGIFYIDLKDDTQTEPIPVPLDNFHYIGEFNPHGVGLLITDKNEFRDLLFVVNHRKDFDTIEIFLIKKDSRLTYYDTITHPLLKSLNDVIPTGLRAFYATNDHYTRGHGTKMAEDLLGICKSNIIFLDYANNKSEVVADNLCFANSVFLSPNKKYLYYTETAAGKLHVAQRFSNGSISQPILTIPMNTMVDNIHINPEVPNTLWIASHPNGPMFLKHAIMGGLSPSQVYKVNFKADSPKQVTLKKDSKYELKEMLQSDGSDISGSSIAAEWEGKVVIGSVFDDHVLICQV